MKALVFNGPRDIRYESFDEPTLPSPNAAILKVEKCSICGSDLHIYHGDQIGKTTYDGSGEKFCVGHEFIGEVVETGPEAVGFITGDRVLASGGSGCGNCLPCRRGQPMQCRQATAFGVGPGLQGGQAEYVAVPNAAQTLRKIEVGISDEHAMLMTDAMATAHFGLSRTELRPGETVVVVGLGPIGLIGVELAAIYGAGRIFAIDPTPARRAHAEKLGAEALAPGPAALDAVRAATGGAGADRVFEASGAKAAVESVLPMVRRGGGVSFIGLPQGGASLPLSLILYKNVTVRGGLADVTATWSTLAPLILAGKLKAEGLFSHTMPLSEGAEAYRLFDAREDGVLKIMMNVA